MFHKKTDLQYPNEGGYLLFSLFLLPLGELIRGQWAKRDLLGVWGWLWVEEMEAEGVWWQGGPLCRPKQQLTAEIRPALLTPQGRGVMCPVVASRYVPAPSQQGKLSPAAASRSWRLGLFSPKPSWELAIARGKISWENRLAFFFKYQEP